MKFPHVLTLLTLLMVVFSLLTWLVPAGEFERRQFKNKQVVVPGTYQQVEQQGQSLMQMLMAPVKGFKEAADIIGFVFLVGGAFGVVNRTGAIEAALHRVIDKVRARPSYRHAVIPLLMLLFSLGGSTFGMAEEVLVFILITVPLARSLGYDAIVGAAIPFVGAGVGFAGAFINPFTVGIAQGIAELPPGSGFAYRLLTWMVMTLTGIGFVAWYGHRIHRDPALSHMHGCQAEPVAEGAEVEVLTGSRVAVLWLLAATIGLLVFGVQNWGWYIEEIAGLFFGMGLLVAALYRLPASEAVAAFVKGAGEVMVAALIIGFSRGLLVLAADGKIIDTILNSLAGLAQGFSAVASVGIMFLFQSFLNFFVPSGSGQAALTMPIMAPLSDLLGISRQVAVLAYQFGDGISNLVIPTSGVTMGVLELARIPYDRWFRFVMPLVVLLSVVAMLLLIPPVTFYDWQ